MASAVVWILSDHPAYVRFRTHAGNGREQGAADRVSGER